MKKIVSLFVLVNIISTYTFSQPLSGNYTIGGSSPDYATFTAAVNALTGKGVRGPVVFYVSPDTYNEQITIPAITGASADNTITFRSSTKDNKDVVLTWAASGSDDNFTVRLDGAGYISFQAITLQATGTNYGRVVHLTHAASHISFLNDRLLGQRAVGELLVAGLPDVGEDACSHITLKDSYLENGNQSISLQGRNIAHLSNIVIERNEIIDPTTYAIYLNYAEHSWIAGNTIRSQFSPSGIRIDGLSSGDTINGNAIRLYGGDVGIHIYEAEATTDTTVISNNFIRLIALDRYYQGINIYRSRMPVKVLSNTIHITGNSPYSTCLYFNGNTSSYYKMIRNNILANDAWGMALYSYYIPDVSDYNAFYSKDLRIINYAQNHGVDLEFWQDNFALDLHSLSVDPYFINADSWQVQNLALDGAGIPLAGVRADIEGDKRDPDHPDIGADEFTPDPAPLHGSYALGTSTADFRTLNDVLSALEINGVSGPVIFNILPGTYTERLVIGKISGVSETNTVTFRSSTGDSSDVVISYGYPSTISMLGARYIRFRQLTILTNTINGIPLIMKDGSCLNEISGSKITAPAGNNNPLVHLGRDNHAFYNYTDSNNVFRDCHFMGGKYAVNAGVEGDGSAPDVARNTLVESCVLDSTSLDLFRDPSPVIRNNTIRVITDERSVYAIALRNGQVVNNFIYMRSSGTAYHHGIVVTDTATLLFNTVRIDGPGLPVMMKGPTVLKNNILMAQDSTALLLQDTVGNSMDHNIYFSLAPAKVIYYNTMVNSAYFPLESWQEHSSFDKHSLFYEPRFTASDDVHTYDLWLNARGVPVAGITTDIDGDTRDASHPDIGADEFDGVYVLGEDTTICNNTSITLDAGAGYDSYLWNTGATTQTLETTPQRGGEMWYKATVTVGGITYSDSVKVTSTGPVVDLGADTAICEGSSLTLDAGSGDHSYLWSDNSTGQTLDVTSAGTYHVTVTDTHGCMDQDTVTVTVNTPVTVTLSYDTDNNRLAADYQNGTLYTWYLDGNDLTSGADAAITPSASGDYHVEVIDENGCTAVSDTLYVSLTGIHDAESHGVSIYPNPSTGKITLRFDEFMEDLQISVFDLTGNKVYETTKEQQGATQKILNLQALPDGIYLLQIRSQAPQKILRIVIHH